MASRRSPPSPPSLPPTLERTETDIVTLTLAGGQPRHYLDINALGPGEREDLSRLVPLYRNLRPEQRRFLFTMAETLPDAEANDIQLVTERLHQARQARVRERAPRPAPLSWAAARRVSLRTVVEQALALVPVGPTRLARIAHQFVGLFERALLESTWPDIDPSQLRLGTLTLMRAIIEGEQGDLTMEGLDAIQSLYTHVFLTVPVTEPPGPEAIADLVRIRTRAIALDLRAHHRVFTQAMVTGLVSEVSTLLHQRGFPPVNQALLQLALTARMNAAMETPEAPLSAELQQLLPVSPVTEDRRTFVVRRLWEENDQLRARPSFHAGISAAVARLTGEYMARLIADGLALPSVSVLRLALTSHYNSRAGIPGTGTPDDRTWVPGDIASLLHVTAFPDPAPRDRPLLMLGPPTVVPIVPEPDQPVAPPGQGLPAPLPPGRPAWLAPEIVVGTRLTDAKNGGRIVAVVDIGAEGLRYRTLWRSGINEVEVVVMIDNPKAMDGLSPARNAYAHVLDEEPAPAPRAKKKRAKK